MLTRLTIQDVVLIEKLSLDLTAGLNVFTGETGAGKSILLDALGLALGGRSDVGLIRAGAAQASVTAEFNAPSDSLDALTQEQGLTLEDTIILRRVITRDGKSRAFFNDQPISISLLKQIGECLLEIHGQFETHGLLNPATHRGLLDAFGSLSGEAKKTATAYAAWQSAQKDYTAAANERTRAEAEEEFLRAAVSELNELAPEDGEIEKLAVRRTQLQHREKIVEALASAEQALSRDRHSVSLNLQNAGKAIARIADKAEGLPDLLALIDRASADVGEINKQLARLMHDIDAEPDALQHIEERLFALRAIGRKHGVGSESLVQLQADLTRRLNLLTDQSDQLNKLAKLVATSKHSYKQLAETLSAKRKNAAAALEKAIARELPPLKLDRAQFFADIAALPEDQWGEFGMDRITFLASTNPGAPPAQLQKVASGGELARFMLSLKVVLAASDPVPTMVFDEVDAGIGGATASAVGERLARLAHDMQILVITHSPQVAARGNHHLRVMKEVRNKQAVTDVMQLSHDERIEEIARMLSGTQVTDAARQAAQSLVEDHEDSAPPSKKPAKRARA